MNPLPELKTQLKLAPLRQLGTRRLTKAHLLLAQRPGLSLLAREYAASVTHGIGSELGAALELEPALLETRVYPQTDLSDQGVFAVFDLGAAGGVAVLELELPFCVALLTRLATREPTRAAPALRLTRIEEATLGYLLLAGLAAGRSAAVEQQFRPRLRRLTTDRAAALGPIAPRQLHLVVELRLASNGVAGSGRLYLPASMVRTAAEMHPAMPHGALAPELAEFGLELSCTTAPVVLSGPEVNRLRVGDAVVLSDFSLCDGELAGPVRLTSPWFVLEGHASAHSFAFSQARTRHSPQESAMPLPDQTEVTPPLPVDVEVQLTRMRLSLGELASLKPGAILPLQITASEPVTLRIGDRVIARAELVDIEGEVAARILSLS